MRRKTLGLTLRAIGGAGAVEAHELRIGGGIEARFDLQGEGAARRIRQQELRRVDLKIRCGQRRAVDFRRDKDEFVAFENQRRFGATLRIGPDRER